MSTAKRSTQQVQETAAKSVRSCRRHVANSLEADGIRVVHGNQEGARSDRRLVDIKGDCETRPRALKRVALRVSGAAATAARLAGDAMQPPANLWGPTLNSFIFTRYRGH